MPRKYHSQIPKNAREKIVERYPDRSRKVAKYFLGRKLVGRRIWNPADEGGHLIWDTPYRNGVCEGLDFSFYWNGQIELAEPYLDGVVHGTARHYAPDGILLGTYRLVHGTGVDLWRDHVTGGLREEWHYEKGSVVLGRCWNGDDRTIFKEYYCRPKVGYHGVWREWTDSGTLRRGFPQYWVRGKKVTKRQYLRACEDDSTLPEYRCEEDQPRRKLPAEYVRQAKGISEKRRNR